MVRREKRNILVVAGKKENQLFTGEKSYYEELSLHLSHEGANSYVYPFDPLSPSRICYYFDATKKEWRRSPFPNPTFVYNRYPFREGERGEKIVPFLQQLKKEGIPYFNESFFNKEKIHEILSNNNELYPHYPKSILLKNMQDFIFFLQQNKDIFIKDSNGSQGKGIWRIERNNNTYTLYTQKKKIERLPLPILINAFQPLIEKRQLLMQEKIYSAKKNNYPYDFRILMIHDKKKWQLVGIGARSATHGGYTTHVPQGGSILSLEEVPIQPKRERIEKLGEILGTELQNHFGHVQEFSFDLIPDKYGNLWMVDVNSKPMSFDEPLIQKKRVELLSNIFLSNE